MVRREEAADREALKGLIHSFIILTSKIQTVTGKPYHSVLTNIQDPDEAPIAEVRKHLPELRELEKSLEAQLAQF